MAFAHVSTILRQVRRMAGVPTSEGPSDRELLRAFADERDGAAFEVLLGRHGRMVWSVCRRVLRHEHDAENAFQATFLVLARKAGAVGWSDSIAGWLYEVARRVAENARRIDARRCEIERRVARQRAEAADDRERLLDEADLLAEELARLPQKYRAPVVLCYLEGLSHPEAARQLGWPVGTVKGRLARAREELRRRLGQRGVTVSVAAVAALLADQAAGAAPATVAEATVQVAVLVAAGSRVAPGPVTVLAHGMLRTINAGRLKALVALALGLCIAGAGVGLAARQAGDKEQPASAPETAEGAGHSSRLPAGAEELPLPAGAVARFGTRRLRHAGFIRFVAFSQDGRTLVSEGPDGIRVWDAATGKELRRFGEGGATDMSRDAKRVAIRRLTGGRSEVELREVATGRVDRTIVLPSAKSGWPKVRLSPDGKTVALYGTGRGIELWEATTGEQLHAWAGASKQVWDVAFTNDGASLISGGDDQVIHVWDVASGKQRREIGNNLDEIGHIVVSPDDALLASVSCKYVTSGGGGYWPPDNSVHLWDMSTGKLLRRITVPPHSGSPNTKSEVAGVAFSPDGKKLVTSAIFDPTIRVWDTRTGAELRQIAARTAMPGMNLAFSPDGKKLAYASYSTIRVRDFNTGEELLPGLDFPGKIDRSAISDDGRLVATAAGPTVFLWDPVTGRPVRRLDGHESEVKALTFVDANRTLLSASEDRTLRAWDVATGKETRKLPFHGVTGFRCSFSPDGKLLATSSEGEDVLVLDTLTGKEVQALKGHSTRVVQLLFGPDSRTLLVCDADNVVRVWDSLAAKEIRHFLPDLGKIAPWLDKTALLHSSVLSPDGRLLVFTASNGVTIVDARSGKELRQLQGTGITLSSLTFSPDSRTLAWGDRMDGSFGLFEVATGQEQHRFTGHEGRVLSSTFSADGRRLISESEDGTALVWDRTGALDGKTAAPLSPANLDALWADLASDAAPAYRAIRALSASPKEFVPFLRRALPPIEPADASHVKRLIADLDNERFVEREKAAGELERLVDVAAPAVLKALEGQPSAEARRRLTDLVEQYGRKEADPSPERRREIRALQALELAGTLQARSLLEDLARGAPGARRTIDAKAALTRLSHSAP
jgi:RNA polymerase sigma factor (sigma-70 family)